MPSFEPNRRARAAEWGGTLLKRIALLAVIGAAMLALPSSAAAQSGAVNCPAGVQVSANYACVYVNGAGGEIVINPTGCSYINGWATNPGTPGYAGLCTGATSRGPSCNPQTTTVNANTGGCFQIKDAPPAVNQALNTAPVSAVTAMFICGNTTGEDPRNTPRDGCAIP